MNEPAEPTPTHQLLDLDLSEASVVRRRLQHWAGFPQEAIRSLFPNLAMAEIREPDWVANVYPLYYWAYDQVKAGGAKVYDYIWDALPSLFPSADGVWSDPALRLPLKRAIDSEIDILVEDRGYFLFIEAKTVSAGQRIIFQNRYGVKQLIRQYVQGKILEELVGKQFALGTIGVGLTPELIIQPETETELALLRLVNGTNEALTIINLAWPVSTLDARITAGYSSR